MTVHHLLMTGLIVYTEKITNKTWIINVLISVVGLFLLNIFLIQSTDF